MTLSAGHDMKEGAANLGVAGACVGAPVGLVTGIWYGATQDITGNKVLDLMVGASGGIVVGAATLGVTGATIGAAFGGLSNLV